MVTLHHREETTLIGCTCGKVFYKDEWKMMQNQAEKRTYRKGDLTKPIVYTEIDERSITKQLKNKNKFFRKLKKRMKL